MEIVSIVLSNKYKNSVEELYQTFLFESDFKDLDITCLKGNKFFKINVEVKLLKNIDLNAIQSKISDVLEKYIRDYFQDDIVKSIIEKQFNYTGEKLERIFKHYEDYKKEFNYPISQYILKHIKSSITLNIEGFVRFSLSSMIEQLTQIVEYAIDEFKMDAQYQEFVSLLQYFVYIQEPKMEEVNLVHKGGVNFDILDDKMQPIELTNDFKELNIILGDDLVMKDMIITNLVNISPRNIVIRTKEADNGLVKTIQSIFENRVRISSR